MNNKSMQTKVQESDRGISRRRFLQGMTSIPVLLSGGWLLQGCAVDPVTGKQQLVMMSREQEIDIDRKYTPFQFSSDYGRTQDQALTDYINQVGRQMAAHVHRRDMPYNFQCVNATYINAYAFPGGSIAATRGILLKLKNEAELAGLLGHELGHVNARHSAEQMAKSQITSLIVGGLSILAATQSSELGQLSQQLGALGQGLFLSSYSRDNEREADSLGQEYMVKTGYNSKGFVGLMEMLNGLHKSHPSSAQILFATHPMSSERLAVAQDRSRGPYQHSKDYPVHRERYMDHLASLRKIKAAIVSMQEGESFLNKGEYDHARKAFQSALAVAPEDYTAHVLMAKCLLLNEKPDQAVSYARDAARIYPDETQGHYIYGLSSLRVKKFDQALDRFSTCENLLPGNPQVTFYRGYSLEHTGNRRSAAQAYQRYLKMINFSANKYSKYAYQRLQEWGYAS